MIFVPRYYQTEAINSGIGFFNSPGKFHAYQILPTGSGKSVVIANIGKELSGHTLVLQPSKEILEQNFAKYCSYGFRAGIYSDSLKQKHVDKVTFATIGSIVKKHYMFRQVQNIIVDECHLVNPEEGMYQDFIGNVGKAKVLGLTATPYRLKSAYDGSMLEFIDQSAPRIFSKCLYYVQNDVLFNQGHLAPLDYYSFDVIDRGRLQMNNKGTDFTTQSIRDYYRTINFEQLTADKANKILKKRKSLLIFCSTQEESKKVSSYIPGSIVISDETETEERANIIKAFKAGRIRCVINCRVLDTGFDYPGLESVLIALSTMSLARYYQIVGRVMRWFVYPDGTIKRGMVVDLGGNIKQFGKIETMRLIKNDRGYLEVWNNGRQLTGVSFKKAA